MAGMADIVGLTEALRGYAADSRRWLLLPLHSALSAEDQDKVFDAGAHLAFTGQWSAKTMVWWWEGRLR